MKLWHDGKSSFLGYQFLRCSLFFFFKFFSLLLLFWPYHRAHTWDLSSPTRDWTVPPTVEVWSPNHWTARKALKVHSWCFECWHLHPGTDYASALPVSFSVWRNLLVLNGQESPPQCSLSPQAKCVSVSVLTTWPCTVHCYLLTDTQIPPIPPKRFKVVPKPRNLVL